MFPSPSTPEVVGFLAGLVTLGGTVVLRILRSGPRLQYCGPQIGLKAARKHEVFVVFAAVGR